MPRNHTGLGTPKVPGQPDAKVVLAIAPQMERGWQTYQGSVSGEPSALQAAFDNDREAELVHDATGFAMRLTIMYVTIAEGEGLAQVMVDISKTAPSVVRED